MSGENNNKLADKISSVSELESSFSFIEDETLRRNLALVSQYIIFLIAVLEQEEAEKTTVGASINKDMIVQTATIV